MKGAWTRMLWAVLAVVCLTGCQTLFTQVKANKAMLEGRYDDSVVLFKEVLQKDPDHAEALKGLGETYLRMQKPAEAIPVLERALRLYPSDKVAAVNLGLAHSLMEAYGKAVEIWRPVAEKEPESQLAGVIRKQITLALYKDAAREAREAVRQEKALQASPGTPDTVAVTYFGGPGLPEQAKPLQKALAAMLITDLSKAGGVKVVERIRLQKLLEEMQLGSTGLVDGRTAPRVGRLLGAGRVATGNLLLEGGKQMDVKGLLTNVATGAESGRQEASGPLPEFFKVQKALAFGILRDMGISLTPEQREAVSRYTAQSYPGLLYYGQGLDAQDRGEWDRAIEIFQRCLTEDPNGPCATALLWAPSGDDAAASASASGMATATSAAAAADAAAAAASSSDGGG